MKMLLLAVSIMLLGASCSGNAPAVPYQTPLSVGSREIFVQVVSNSFDVARGLSGRERLKDSQGMLFDFRGRENFRPAFWMKEMKFGLDLIWIREGKIIDVTENVPAPQAGTPDDELPRYYPAESVDMVLEVSAGWTEKNKIKIGDSVRLMN